MTCCGIESVWIENVPGKGYFYCRITYNTLIAANIPIDTICPGPQGGKP